MPLHTTGIPLANSGAEKTGNIGRVRCTRWTIQLNFIKIVIQVITSPVEKQTDMQRFTAGRFHQPTRCLAKFIAVGQFVTVLLFTVLAD
ncbi:hypothetical protein SB6410_05403 [Klebsiella pasteurii]|uniref:Uncharacterized protein n=1 Tax=Klebsiella pasteurii TaxID=2587529 RepID=A0A9Q9S600_9ENTR|nr:hypothetical protein SB6410_05403 [Klebsiella pasteurii]